MRKASEVERFPYMSATVCYIEVKPDGTTNQVNRSELKEVYERVSNGESKLYCAWPGNYRTDLFEIDDMADFADAFGFERAGACIHNLVWELDDYDDGRSVSAKVSIRLKCGCDLGHIRAFAPFAKKYLDWDVAVTRGSSSRGTDNYNTIHTIHVKRSSMRYSRGELTSTGELINLRR